MSEGKLAAQVAHAVKNLAISRGASFDSSTKWFNCDIVVLGVSDKKFYEQERDLVLADESFEIQIDKGLTEIPAGTDTTIAWIENE